MIKIEHIAMWVKDLEGMRDFYIKYFDASSNERYFNARTNFSSYFLSFSDGCRLELMRKSEIIDAHDELHIEFTGLVHFAISLGSSDAVDMLTEQLRNDGFEVVREPRTTGDGYYESIVLDPEAIKLN